MKYAENNRISHRQLYRQILLTFLAPFLLCLNGKGGLLGLSGVMGIILAVIFLLLYSFFYLRSTYGYADMIRSFGKAGAVIFGGLFSYLSCDGGSVSSEPDRQDHSCVADLWYL